MLSARTERGARLKEPIHVDDPLALFRIGDFVELYDWVLEEWSPGVVVGVLAKDSFDVWFEDNVRCTAPAALLRPATRRPDMYLDGDLPPFCG